MPNVRIAIPHLISGLLIPSERAKTVCSLNFCGDINNSNVWEVYLDFVFRVVNYSIVSKRKKYYIGCQGAIFKMLVMNAEIKNHVSAGPILVAYSNSMEIKDESGASFNPTLEAKGNKVSIGKVSSSSGKTKTGGNSFNYNAYPAVVTVDTNEIEWRYDLPRVMNPVRDYLIGNSGLGVSVQWNDKIKQGSFNMEPARIHFFNRENKKIDGIRSTLMFLALSLFEKKKIRYPRGLKFNFEIEN